MDKPLNIATLRAATGISKSYACEILSGKRKPAPSLAIRIYRSTGHKLPPIVELDDDKINRLERMIGEVAAMTGAAA